MTGCPLNAILPLKSHVRTTHIVICLLMVLMGWPLDVYAAIESGNLLDNALLKFQTAAAGWGPYILARASWLFWTLATISLVWTMGQLALRRAEMGEFLGEFLSFTLMTGFFWWLLTNGPTFALQIIDSMQRIANHASGLGSTSSPSRVVDIGFELLHQTVTQSTVWTPVASTVGIIMSCVVLVVLALIGVNLLVLYVSTWILAYAGIFFLGFGGSRWTSDMAIGYYRTVLALGAQLAAMVLLIGIGYSIITNYYSLMRANVSLEEEAVVLIASIMLLTLVNKIPPLIGGLAMGSGVGALGSGVSLVSAIGTAAAMAAGVGLAANMARAGMAGGVAGSQALMQAVSNGAGGTPPPTNMISGPDGGQSGGGPSSTPPRGSPAGSMPLAAAMDGVSPGPQFPGRAYQSVATNDATTSSPSPEPTFGEESLSKDKRDDTTFHPNEEIAAFRDRKEPSTGAKGGNA
jgi:type IV secretion system protein TrbL